MSRFLVLSSFLLLASANAWSQPAAQSFSAQAIQPAPPQASPLSVSTVSDFLAACKTDDSGCANAVGNALMNKIDFYPTSHICISEAGYTDEVPRWLAAHPETSGMARDNGIYLALKSLYGC